MFNVHYSALECSASRISNRKSQAYHDMYSLTVH